MRINIIVQILHFSHTTPHELKQQVKFTFSAIPDESKLKERSICRQWWCRNDNNNDDCYYQMVVRMMMMMMIDL